MQSPGEVSTEQQLVTCSPPAAQETSLVGPREQYTESIQKRVGFCFLYREKVMARKSEIGKYF